MDGGEEAGAQVVVQVLVLAHLEHFLPLLLGHLALDALCSLLLLPDLFTTKLRQAKNTFMSMTTEMSEALCFCGFREKNLCVSHSWVGRGHVAGQEGQSVRKLSDSQSFQASHTLRLEALGSSSNTSTGLCSHT